MLLKYFYDDKLAQASYMVGCSATGEALVIDPPRDVSPYLDIAEREGVQITHITETHIHADFVSGSRELAEATGGRVYLSDMGDEAWKYQFVDSSNVTPVRDGDVFMVGNIKIQVLHTPGHTPEHISFMVTDTAGADEPMGVFTGDFLFVGDVGRPDLLETAAGISGTKEIGARQQFASVQYFKDLPDYLQIWPGHGAGSACGKALGTIPSTTLGYEKRFNPAFQFDDETEFVDWLLADQPEAPRYFAQMKMVNKQGPALTQALPTINKLTLSELTNALNRGDFIIDSRERNVFVQAHVSKTISIPSTSSNFSTYVGWFVDYDAPLYLIVASDDSVQDLVTTLRGIGVDNLAGYFIADEVLDTPDSLPVMTADELAQRMTQNGIVVLDVRGQGEYCEQHIKGAKNFVLGMIPDHLSEIPKERTVVAHCASGYRSQVATSWLRAHGYQNVVNLDATQSEWSTVLDTESC